jgi:lipopolysaccharide/colanic/teichoic acid biosynthesis glycosyltransferase
MKLIVIHKKSAPVTDAENSSSDLLKFALASEPIADLILGGLCGCLPWDSNRHSVSRFSAKRSTCRRVCAIPEEWSEQLQALQHRNGTKQRPFLNTDLNIIPYAEGVPIPSEFASGAGQNDAPSLWIDICNGRYATRTDSGLLERVLDGVRADVVAVNLEPELLGEREKVRLTTQGGIAGFRRLYSDSAEFAPFPADWPHHLLVKIGVLAQVLADGALPKSFAGFLEACRSNALTLRSINVGGTVLDLETEGGLLNFCRTVLSKAQSSKLKIRNSNTISEGSRFVGKVLLGENIHVGPDVIIVGPTVIGNNVKIERGAVINSSVIGPEVCVPEKRHVQDCIVKGPQYDWGRPVRCEVDSSEQVSCPRYDSSLPGHDYAPFRTWSRFSYVRCLKRFVDFLGAVVVLILFAPLMPFVALAIRLTSPGPIFFGDKRQGLHGQEFKCLKFRTMVTGADKIQEKLRVVSQVDGPQFKMADDPRISTVGRFLRETYIDEIPQFFNVLLGQMSIVGPRPSPESENTLCPFWRDARLSIRPGITGLWQVHRTRKPMKDFQEWIHYDIEYVRNLSLRMDLWVCWLTTKKLFGNFIGQF